ncbi:MAG: hypothetical protein GX422_13820 [Deltaproteobacteria bacterium]|nr:hypothetical protein [Deltaproteobacteria bacterium]
MRLRRLTLVAPAFFWILLGLSRDVEAVHVHTTQELVNAVGQANTGGDRRIVVHEGVYDLDNMLWISADNVTVRGASGDREAVIIQGKGMGGSVTHVFNVAGSQFCVRDMTLRRVSQHAIQTQPTATSPRIQNVHILDTGEQMVKIAYDSTRPDLRTDNGIMEDCLLEYSAGIGPQWYIGGIDAHNARNWIVRNNVFRHIRSPSGALAEHAVHFWSDSRDTLVESNVIVNCDRGIGFGLGDRGHRGGIIRNNMITHDASEGFADAGISLESAPGAQVLHNSILFEHSYTNAIEYRFAATTDVVIMNNLTNRAIARRDGASATVIGNVKGAKASWFVDPAAGDLHLKAAVSSVVDRASFLDSAAGDFDGDNRPEGEASDTGADEYRSSLGKTVFDVVEHAEGRRPSDTYEEDRIIRGHRGEDTVLSFRLSGYGKARPNMPLLVQVHEWGGGFAREEDLASYVPLAYDFIMLYFQYKPSNGNEDDWWFGTRWGRRCRMWAHKAVMEIVREAIKTSLVSDSLPGTSIDPNRVYVFGHSIGGTGAWQLGLRNPDVFAAMHAHSGFARFTGPVGPFRQQFNQLIVGGPTANVTILGDDGELYSARSYSNLGWWLSNYRNPRWETPFVNITAGTQDETVPPASGGDLMQPHFDRQKRGFFYHRHNSGHSEDCFVKMNQMWNFRRNQSFLAFTNRSDFGIGPRQSVNPGEPDGVNNLYAMGWDPHSIVDRVDRYEALLTGSGTADVTPRRLQKFRVFPRKTYRYWLNVKTGAGLPLRAGKNGLLTIPQVSGGTRLIIERDF